MTIQEIDKATPERAHQHPPGRGGHEGVLRRQPALAVHGPDQPAGRAHQQAPPLGAGPRRPRRASAPGSTSATCTTATTAASAPSRRRKARTSASSARWPRTAASTSTASSRRPTARSSGPSPGTTRRSSARSPTSDVATKSGTVVLKKGATFTKDAVAELKKQKATAFPIRPRVTDEIVYLAAYDEEERYVAQANAKLDERGLLRGRARARPPPRPVPRGASAADRVHGREPQAGRLRGDRADPVPRARRRQPRPDGLEHAAPGGAAPRARGAHRRHRHGGARRAGLRPGADRQARRHGAVRDRRADPHRARRGPARRARHLPPREVRALQPGHVHQPASHRGRRHARRGGGCAGGQQLDRQRRAGARPQHPGRVHELGGWQLRGRHRHQRSAGPRGPLHQHPHREARARVTRHQARPRGDHPRHPERRRGVPQGPRRGRHRLHRRRGPAGRHPGRQDHAQGRDRADRRGAPAARDLR